MGLLNIYCPHCGAENVRGPAKCSSCGHSLQGATSTPPPGVTPAKPPSTSHETLPARVVVVDFGMPMGSMIAFMFKWAIASIPAFILLLIVFAIVTALLAGVGAGLAGS